MEETKKEECCENKKHHHGCCGHKGVKMLGLCLAMFMVFLIGVSVGSHLGYGRDFGRDSYGSRMMRGAGYNTQGEVGGCRFQEGNTEVNSGCPMKNGGAATGVVGCPMQNQNQNIVPATPLTPVK